MKTTVYRLKNSPVGIKSRLGTGDKRINELKGIPTETSQHEAKSEK